MIDFINRQAYMLSEDIRDTYYTVTGSYDERKALAKDIEKIVGRRIRDSIYKIAIYENVWPAGYCDNPLLMVGVLTIGDESVTYLRQPEEIMNMLCGKYSLDHTPL